MGVCASGVPPGSVTKPGWVKGGYSFSVALLKKGSSCAPYSAMLCSQSGGIGPGPSGAFGGGEPPGGRFRGRMRLPAAFRVPPPAPPACRWTGAEGDPHPVPPRPLWGRQASSSSLQGRFSAQHAHRATRPSFFGVRTHLPPRGGVRVSSAWPSAPPPAPSVLALLLVAVQASSFASHAAALLGLERMCPAGLLPDGPCGAGNSNGWPTPRPPTRRAKGGGARRLHGLPLSGPS